MYVRIYVYYSKDMNYFKLIEIIKLITGFRKSKQNSSTFQNIPRLVWNAHAHYGI